MGGEVIIHNVGEVRQKKVIDHNACISWNEFVFLCTDSLGLRLFRYIVTNKSQLVERSGCAFFVSFHNILTLLDGRYGRRIRRRTPDSEFFKFVNQRGFGVTRGLLRKTLLGHDFLAFKPLPFVHGREQTSLFLIVGVVVMRFAIDTKEAVELHDLSGGNELIV